MADKIVTKHGIIRKGPMGTCSGYVSLGEKYFGCNEEEVLMNYIDLGYLIQDNQYILQGGKRIEYIYKYKGIDGIVHEEYVEHKERPIMVMKTRLIKLGE